EGASERHHHQHTQNAARERQHRDLRVIEIARTVRHQEEQRRDLEHHAPGEMSSGAGSVHPPPRGRDSPADPIVWTMLFSRIVEPPSFLRTEIARTAMGIDALTVNPARSPR